MVQLFHDDAGGPFIYHLFNASISTFYGERILLRPLSLGRKSFVATSASIGRFFKIPATSMTS
jgi:hypothetical protein